MMIQCKNVQKYHGAELVLSDISFEISRGEKVALIGRNGSGKTTLLRLLNGNETPDQGQIASRKERKSACSPKFRKRPRKKPFTTCSCGRLPMSWNGRAGCGRSRR